MTANNENQTNTPADPDDREGSLDASEPQQVRLEDEWIDNLNEEEFDELEEEVEGDGNVVSATLPPVRAWDETLESSGTGFPPRPEKRISSTFDDLPTYENPNQKSEDSSSSEGPDVEPVLKPGFDEQEQSVHMDAAQLARLAYAIEDAPASEEEKVRHEGSMDASLLAQLAYAIEEDPGRSQPSGGSGDAAHLAGLAREIHGSRLDSHETPDNEHASASGSDTASQNDGEATLRLSPNEDVEATLRTAPQAAEPLTTAADVVSSAQKDDAGATTWRLETQPPVDPDATPSLQPQSGMSQPESQPVLGQLIRRIASSESPANDINVGDELNAQMTASSGPADAPPVKSGFGRLLEQRAHPSQSQNQMPAHAMPPAASSQAAPTAVTAGGMPPAMPSQSPPPAVPSSGLPPGMPPHAPPPMVQSSGVPPYGTPPAMPPTGMPPAMPPAGVPPAMPPTGMPPAMPPAGVPPVMPPMGVPPAMPPTGMPPAMPAMGVPPDVRLNTAVPQQPTHSYNQMPAQPMPASQQPTTIPGPHPPDLPPQTVGTTPPASPYAQQNPRNSASNVPSYTGPEPFATPSVYVPRGDEGLPYDKSARTHESGNSQSVVTGDVAPIRPPALSQSAPGFPSTPTLGAPQQSSQVSAGRVQPNGDTTSEIPLLDREVAATASGEYDAASVIFFGKREAVLVRHAPSMSFKPSTKKSAPQSYITILTTKPVLPKKSADDDTTGETILLSAADAPQVKLAQGLSGAHPVQFPPPSMAPTALDATPLPDQPKEHLMLSQGQLKYRNGPSQSAQSMNALDVPPPVPTTPLDGSSPLDKASSSNVKDSSSRSRLPPRGPVLLRKDSGSTNQEASLEQSMMPSDEGAVMPANRTPLVLGGIVLICMVVGLFAGSMFLKNGSGNAPPAAGTADSSLSVGDKPGNAPQSKMQMALAAEQKQDYARALKFFSAGLTESPDNAELWDGRGRVLTHEGQFVRAESDLRKALELSPGNKKVLLDLAALFYYKKDYGEAIKQYNAIIKKDPDNVDALFGRGLTLVWLDKRKDAIDDFQKVIKLSPNHALAYQQLAVAQMDTGHPKDAIKTLDAGLLSAPKSEGLLFERALANYKLGEKKAAIEDYTQAIKLNSNRKDFFNDRGFVRLELRQYKGAIEDFQRALELDPGYTIAADNLARAIKEQSK